MKTLIKMQFDPKIAKKIGVEEAIMYSNIEYWCEKNKANNKGFYDGYYWTYNSKRAFTELFSFWTEEQIGRILKNLEKKKYIKTGNYNKHKYDRTKWYAIIYQNPKSIVANAIMEKGKRHNGKGQSTEPIPDNKPNNKHRERDGSPSQEISDKILNKIINYYHNVISEEATSGKTIMTPEIKKVILSALQKFSPLNLLLAIKGFASEKDQWSMDNNGHKGMGWFFKDSVRLTGYIGLFNKNTNKSYIKEAEEYLKK